MAGSPGIGAGPRERVLDEIPPALAVALRHAQAAELAAMGSDRRAAWRTTRALLGAAMTAGYSPQLIARCLGTSLESVRTRAERDAWLSEHSIVHLGDVDVVTLRRWRAAGRLTEQRNSGDGSVSYLAAEVVRALIEQSPNRGIARDTPGG